MSINERFRPGPTSYIIKSEFDLNKSSSTFLKNCKGFSFYEPHSAYDKVYNESLPG